AGFGESGADLRAGDHGSGAGRRPRPPGQPDRRTDRAVKRALVLLSWALCASAASATFDYELHPRPVADGVFVLARVREHFTRDNGGNILNTGYLVTPEGAVVIDTGPSRRYGERMRAAIGGPVATVFVTHAHPDHFLGDQAFAGVPIVALPATRAAIARSG